MHVPRRRLRSDEGGARWYARYSTVSSFQHRPTIHVVRTIDPATPKILLGIFERLPHAKAVHKWAFHRLYEYVTYKAESEGLVVTQINPAYTSHRCSKCGFTHEDNRPNQKGQDEFECLKCEYEVHADYNAAKNIGVKYLRDQQKSGRGGAPVGVRLNSGMMNVNGEYSPTPLPG